MKRLALALGLVLLAVPALAQNYPEPDYPETAQPQFEAPLTAHALDNSTIATAGTAVTAIAAGHALRGGLLTSANPYCFALIGPAGTASSGDTICEPAGASVTLPPTGNAVSINSTTAGTISGYEFY